MKVKPTDMEQYEIFWTLNHYVVGSYDMQENFEKLNAKLKNFESGQSAHRIFYLALPPKVFESVTSQIRKNCMAQK